MLKRILILEENTNHLELLTNLLETRFAPIDIHTVENIEDFLDFLEQTDYDLILTGCFIHNICIAERMNHIVPRSRGIPIIVISGSGDEKMAANLIKLGASEYVVKSRKAMEEIPTLVERYLKKSTKKAERPGPRSKKAEEEASNHLLREIDRLMQKARSLTSTVAASSLPKDVADLDALFAQIQRLRSLVSKLAK